MRLLVAIGVLMTLGGAANAASVQDEARQFFERFVAAQNAHDLATVGSMLWNSEDFLFDNQVLAQAVMLEARIGEVSCPTKYFPEASSISFRRARTSKRLTGAPGQ